MTKQIKKKNIFQMISDIDARQQADIDARQKNAMKKPNKKTTKKAIKLSKKTRTILIILTLSLPFIAWGLGALINPHGWVSDNPSNVVSILVFMVAYYWFLSIPVVILIIALLVQKKKDVATILIFAISLIISLFIMIATVTANESEFTD